LLDFRALVHTAKGKVYRIRGWAILVCAVKAKGNRHGNGSLHNKALTAIIEIRRLSAILECPQSGDGNTLGIEGGWIDDAGHVLIWFCLFLC
jgi:hypothetical protein